MLYTPAELNLLVSSSESGEVECYVFVIEVGNLEFKKLLKPQRGVMRRYYGNIAFHPLGKRGLPLAKGIPDYSCNMFICDSMEECIERYEVMKIQNINNLRRMSSTYLNMINEL
jgi:hypothetical protein